MNRIIFVPQYPTPMRYQEWWYTEFPKQFHQFGLDVYVVGVKKLNEMQLRRGSMSMFSPIHAAIEFECAQIDEYMNLELRENDILFLADISFPGFFSNALYHKRPKRCFAFCHATSLNILDYFEQVRFSKFPVETAHSKMFTAIFIGSNYHENKLKWENTIITRLPYPPIFTGGFQVSKEIDIISASRDNPQKVDKELEQEIEETFGKIKRPASTSWFNYEYNLQSSKILLVTSFEDTFGYQIVDAIMNGCIPLAPNRCAYPELLPKEYLYNDRDELISKIDGILDSYKDEPFSSRYAHPVPVPNLLCHKEMKNFYSNIIEILTGDAKGDYPF